MSRTWASGSDDLRALVREVIREAMPASGARAAADPVPPTTAAPPGLAGGPAVVEPVSLRTDADLATFVQRILDAAVDPLTAGALRTGRIRFVLAGVTPVDGAPASRAGICIPKGAVTERHVRQAAEAGVPLILGRNAVLTPLARDRARAVGLTIERES